MKYDTVIFDLDGTLINSLEDLKNSVNYALYGFRYPKKTLDEVRARVGNGVEKLMERCIPDGIDNPAYEPCLTLFKEHYAKNMEKNTKVYPLIMDMLVTLKTRGYKIAVVSNKFDVAVKPLCKKYFGDLVDIAIGQSHDTNKKPAPDTVYLALDYLNSTSDKSIFVGDSEVDIQTAINSKMPCISVTWGFKTREFLIEHDAKILIDSPMEIFSYV